MLEITVEVDDDRPPPVGAALRVEVRDISLADALAETLCSTDALAAAAVPGQPCAVAHVTLDLDRVPDLGTVWVHVDVDGDGRVSVGDFITMQSYPIPAGGTGAITVTVRRV